MQPSQPQTKHPRALSEEDVRSFSTRVAIHLERGAFHVARDLIDEAEAMAIRASQPLSESELREMAVAELDIGNRITNALESIGCLWVGDVIDLRDEEILEIPSFGANSLRVLRAAIERQRPKHTNTSTQGPRVGNIKVAKPVFDSRKQSSHD